MRPRVQGLGGITSKTLLTYPEAATFTRRPRSLARRAKYVIELGRSEDSSSTSTVVRGNGEGPGSGEGDQDVDGSWVRDAPSPPASATMRESWSRGFSVERSVRTIDLR